MADDFKRPSLQHRGSGNGTRQVTPLDFCRQTELKDRWSWGLWDIVKWKTWPESMGRKYLFSYKDAWVKAHAGTIKKQAGIYRLSKILLAGVCWNEVGGDPDWIDKVAYSVRSFDHSADPDPPMPTITKQPQLTSFGDVSIQLRRAAEAAGLNMIKMSSKQKDELIKCLSDEDVNIAFVAKHIAQLKKIDKVCFTEDYEIKIIGARYNRGPHLSLEQIKQNTSYGDSILKRKKRLETLIR